MLTPSDLKALRRLLTKAGSEAALRREIKRAKQLPNRGRGRPASNDTDEMLAELEAVGRAVEQYGFKRHMAFRAVARNAAGEKGENATARRYARKLRERKFTEEELFMLLVKLGWLDPTKHPLMPPRAKLDE